MKTLYRSVFALGLVFAAASCGSDSDSSDTTAAEASATTVASSADSGDATATTTEATTTEATTADTAGSSDGSLQDQVAEQALEEGANLGITFDETCLRTAVAALTDADAQAILDAGVTGDPNVSPAGDAVATAIGACIKSTSTTAAG
jgi:hypothetical protein